MKKAFYLLILTFLVFKAVGQKTFTNTAFQDLKWLQGSWKGMAGSSPFYEGWRFYNDSILVNFSIEIKNSDTLIRESSALVFRNGQVIFGQNPTQWQATRLQQNEVVLRNDSLPYSNTIIWLHTKDGRWFTILQHPKSTVYYEMTRDAILDKKVDEWLKKVRK